MFIYLEDDSFEINSDNGIKFIIKNYFLNLKHLIKQLEIYWNAFHAQKSSYL
jgi:hypothetical protein